MSQRAIEKSIVLKREFDEHYRRAMYQVAYVTGLCFVLIGAAFAGSTLMTEPVFNNQVAQLADSLQEADPVTTDQITQTSIPDATIKLLTTLPEVSDADFNVRVGTTYTNRLIVKVKQVCVGCGFMQDPVVSDRGEGEYRFTIPASQYPVGTYQLILIAEGENGRTPPVTVPSGYFRVPSLVGIGAVDEDVPDVQIDEETGLVNVTEYEREREVFIDPSPVNQEFSIFKSATILTGVETIGVHVPGEYAYIELYARPVSGGDARFVALASTRFDRWQFAFDSRRIPNGEYDFYAQTREGSALLVTDTIRLSVVNEQISLGEERIISPTSDSVGDTSIRRDAIEDRESVVPIRSLSIADEPISPLTPEDDRERRISLSVDGLLSESATDLDTLFQDLAAARRSGDDEEIAAAQAALRERRAMILDSMEETGDSESEETADRVVARFEMIEARIQRFEELRKERFREPEGALTDSDGDGILDIDELRLYETNPNEADTDGDGIPDGMELVRGMDPRSDRAEERIRYESPKQTIGLTQSDLVVTAVNAITSQTASTSDGVSVREVVKTEIRGEAFPNSFVTLYIFSTPTVVTIKTDSDGSFVYTFDKELEDGGHDVYVAVTDATGNILAQSSPFSFVKRAEAFTPVDAAESEVTSAPSVTDPAARGYNVAIGVGVLALGVILLMLGIGLRTKDDELQQIKITTDDEGSNSPQPSVNGRQIEHIDAT